MSDYIKEMEAEFNAMRAVDAHAKSEGKLEGRYIQEQIADGYAYYVVVEVGEQTVRVEHQKFFDGYSVPMIESMGGIIPIHYVRENIEARDQLNEMFSKRSREHI